MNRYNVLVTERTESNNGQRKVEFEFENHDDLFHIVERIKATGIFCDKQEAAQFSIGLKLFSAVMIKYRHDELFKDFEPAFIEFMKKLKNRK